MNCPQLFRVGVYKDGEMAASDRAAFAAHLTECAACSAELSRLERMSHWFSAAKNATQNPHAAWRSRLNERRIERLATMLTAAAAVVLVACGLMLAKRSETTSSASTTPVLRTWERVAVTHQFESAQPAEAVADSEDPMVQLLFQDVQQ